MSISWMIEILEKGKAYPVGTIRKWGGLDYMKHPQGWIVVTQGKHYGKMKGQVRSGVAQPHHVDFLNSRKEQSQTNTNAPSNEVKPSPIQTPSPDQKPQAEVKPEGEKKKRGRPKKVIPEGQAEGQKEGQPKEKKPISKILEGESSTFSIPKKYSKFVQGDGNLKNIDKWKVKTQLGNSANEGEGVGTWQNVGYVFINAKTGEIIPVSRSDEHRTGWELMNDLEEKGVIKNIDDWENLFIHGIDIYSKDDYTQEKEAYKKWLDNGGKNIKVEIHGGNNKDSFLGTMKDFIEEKDFKPKKNTLAKPGESLTNAFKDFAHLSVEALKNPNKEKQAIKMAETIFKIIDGYNTMGIPNYKTKEIFKKALETGDFKKIEDAVLGFNGVKNNIHQQLRKYIKEGNHDYLMDNYTRFFGDLKIALKIFEALGNI